MNEHPSSFLNSPFKAFLLCQYQIGHPVIDSLASMKASIQFIFFGIISSPFISSSFSSQQNRQTKQCGLPPNLNELPDFAQDEIRAVWKEYMPGKKCDKEMLITEDILAVLAMFDKELERQGMKGAGGGLGEQEREIGEPTEGEGRGFASTTKAELLSVPETTQPPPPTAQQFKRADMEAERTVEERLPIPSSTFSPTRPSPPLFNTPAPAELISSTPEPPTGPKGPRQIAVENRPPSPSPPPQNPKGQGHQPGKVPQAFGQFGDRSNDEVREENEGPAYLEKEEQQEVRRPVKQRILAEYEDREDENGGDGPAGEERDLNQQFFEPVNQLPFLRGAKPSVVGVFRQVLEDPAIPSETRRMEEIHVLAVSYLNARQLAKFNAWSTDRRKKIHLREHRLSGSAQKALERLTRAVNERERRAELKRISPEFAQ